MEDDDKENKTEWWGILIVLVAAAVIVGVVLRVTDKPEPDTTLPTPPPGYEFCVIGDEAIGFCERED